REATRLESTQGRARIRKCLQCPIGVEQFGPERTIDRRKTREGEVERALRQRPEIYVAAGERQRPGVFELLAAPDFGETVGVGACRGAMPADGGVHVEQRPIGVEDESARHGGSSPGTRVTAPAGSGASGTIARGYRRRERRRRRHARSPPAAAR